VKGINGISTLPVSLQKLVQETEYPPETPSLLQTTTTRVVMIVNSVSPTPFSLLRRTNHFQYRDDDRALQEFAEYEDPVTALTDECRRVLRSISTANQSQVTNSKDATGLKDASWSRFEDIGFSGGFDDVEEEDADSNFTKKRNTPGLRTTPHSRNVGMNGGRPTTPSWADFLSSGFVDEAKNGPAPLLLPPDKILPPIDTRGRSSQSHRPRLESERNLEPGELASITRFELDDTFWWVWISSLAGEEPSERKASFGRCALVETIIRGGRWLVMEEMVKGAAPKPDPTAYIAEKKSFWGRSKKNKGLTRSKSTGKQALDHNSNGQLLAGSASVGMSKTSFGPDQHARIQAAAIQLQQKQVQQDAQQNGATRRGRNDVDMMSQKTSSVFTLQPVIMKEASPAMNWANKYDKDAIKEAYLANANMGRGLGGNTMQFNGNQQNQDVIRPLPSPGIQSQERDLPAVPRESASNVPSKASTPPPAPLPPTPSPLVDEQRDAHQYQSEKAVEVPLPQDSHPLERTRTEAPVTPVATATSQPIVYHPGQKPSLDTSRPSEDHTGLSPESKRQNKLKKREAGGGGGFRKMFGRSKIREPKPSTNLPHLQTQQTQQTQQTSNQTLQPGAPEVPKRFSSFRKKSPIVSPLSEHRPSLAPTPSNVSEDDLTPIASPQPEYERSYDPSIQDTLSRVDTNDAREAKQAFSSFDQGPLEDVPAFVPDDSPRQSEDSAAPPPIRQTRDIEDGSELTKSVSPMIGDRWAQIRKNAAERAARHSEEQSRGGYSAKTDGDDGETSGEESKL